MVSGWGSDHRLSAPLEPASLRLQSSSPSKVKSLAERKAAAVWLCCSSMLWFIIQHPRSRPAIPQQQRNGRILSQMWAGGEACTCCKYVKYKSIYICTCTWKKWGLSAFGLCLNMARQMNRSTKSWWEKCTHTLPPSARSTGLHALWKCRS